MRLCATQGCAAVVDHGHCPEHRSVRQQARYSARWGTGTRLHGTNKWRQYSKRRLAKHPWCVLCAERGIRTLATVTDHISRDEHLFFNPTNHRSLCHLCNSTRPEEHGFGR